MEIEDLRTIGKKLRDMVPRFRLAPDAGEALAIGAAGDRTFPLDRMAEDIILSFLEARGEPARIISEELGVRDTGGDGLRVVIDPIDGSKNAVTGIPFFCTSIAVADGERIGDVFMSYVINLVSGDEFWGVKGRGAYLNGKRMRVQEDAALRVVLYEAQNPSRDIRKILALLSLFGRARCLGAIALDLCHLALGSASAFVAPAPSRSFDFAGGWLVVREAGGVVTDFNGQEIDAVDLGIGKSVPLLSSANARIHERLLKVLSDGTG